jgi:hypothetical protein
MLLNGACAALAAYALAYIADRVVASEPSGVALAAEPSARRFAWPPRAPRFPRDTSAIGANAAATAVVASSVCSAMQFVMTELASLKRDEIVGPLALSLGAGLATALGGLVVCVAPRTLREGGIPPRALAFSLTLAAGVMVGVSWEELILPALKRAHAADEPRAWLAVCVGGGALAAALLGASLPRAPEPASCEDADEPKKPPPLSLARSFDERRRSIDQIFFDVHSDPSQFSPGNSAGTGASAGTRADGCGVNKCSRTQAEHWRLAMVRAMACHGGLFTRQRVAAGCRLTRAAFSVRLLRPHLRR